MGCLQSCGQLIALLFGIAAILCSGLTTSLCDIMEFEPNPDFILSEKFPTLKYGLWRQSETEVVSVTDGGGTEVSVHDTCKNYTSSVDIDENWMAARASSVIAPSLGFLMLPAVAAGCSIGQCMWKFIAVMFILVVTTFQGLTMLVLESNACLSTPVLDELTEFPVYYAFIEAVYPAKCKMSYEAKVISVVSIVLWFLTGLTMLVFGKPGTSPRAKRGEIRVIVKDDLSKLTSDERSQLEQKA